MTGMNLYKSVGIPCNGIISSDLKTETMEKEMMMEVQKVFHMAAGEGENSYALNSLLQKAVICKAKSFVQGTVADLYQKTLPESFTITDLGCSSGPNSLLVIREILDTIHSVCQKLSRKSPEFHVLLNDLTGNDFNTLFKSIPHFQDKLKKDHGQEFGACFISGTPGSFHGRLFPAKSLNFVHSSYSLQILSRVPSGIDNKGHIYITKTSPPTVRTAYFMQFQTDFTTFLSSRAQEVVPQGRMVITLLGRRSSDPSADECCQIWEMIAKSLRDLVSEGRVEEAKLDSFNWPGYFPCPEELRTLIQDEGSFSEDVQEVFDTEWDANMDLRNHDSEFTSGQYISKYARAVTESMISSHFGEEIVEDLFSKYGKHVDEYLCKEKGKFNNLVMCLRRKE